MRGIANPMSSNARTGSNPVLSAFTRRSLSRDTWVSTQESPFTSLSLEDKIHMATTRQ